MEKKNYITFESLRNYPSKTSALKSALLFEKIALLKTSV